MQAEGGELEEAMGQVEVRGGDSDWDDVSSEVAARSAAEKQPTTAAAVTVSPVGEASGWDGDEDDENDEDVLPLSAGTLPLPPGPIQLKPMKGMDCEC